MQDIPSGHVLLKTSGVKFGAMFVFAVAMTLTGVWMWLENESGVLIPLLLICIFGVMGVVALICFVKPGFLLLDETGFRQKMLWRERHWNWRDVENIGVNALSRGHFVKNKFVGFDEPAKENAGMVKVNRAITGRSSQLGDNFGMRAEDLADLMRSFQNGTNR